MQDIHTFIIAIFNENSDRKSRLFKQQAPLIKQSINHQAIYQSIN